MKPKSIYRALSKELDVLEFGEPVTHVYNPLVYAKRMHNQYLDKFGAPGKEVLMLGMNPGPWGMAQTGIPFGEIEHVRDWMGLSAKVDKPEIEHPKRPIQGLDCPRSEVSGRRLWGWVKDKFKTPENFFERFFVANYCPLVFMEESGKNRTPDKLPVMEREPIVAACDVALRRLVEYLQPEIIVGVGAYAEGRAKEALAGMDIRIGRVLHPSPASPVANRGWAERADKDFEKLGIELG
ncbi:MAG: uracil-DNA glycosylase family protein [Myxococcota bacterium]|nr:uracil-DNA glycosylase family protein [Myxococcota bacterium]